VAEQLQVGRTTVKVRNPFLVFVWSLLTLGIYYLVWYYKINRELRDLGRATGHRDENQPFRHAGPLQQAPCRRPRARKSAVPWLTTPLAMRIAPPSAT